MAAMAEMPRQIIRAVAVAVLVQPEETLLAVPLEMAAMARLRRSLEIL
jgi:hypothetical protein